MFFISSLLLDWHSYYYRVVILNFRYVYFVASSGNPFYLQVVLEGFGDLHGQKFPELFSDLAQPF
jgi:hypothetical protein